MKNFITLIATIVVAFGCKEVDKLTQFNMNYNAEVVIESSTILNIPILIETPDIESNSAETFSVNNTNKDKIEEIILTDMTLVITSPSDGDFSFLQSVEIYMSADGLAETQIATIFDIPEDVGTTLDLDTSDTDLKEYIKKDDFALRLNTVTDEAITTDHHIDIRSIFFVDAKVLGQ